MTEASWPRLSRSRNNQRVIAEVIPDVHGERTYSFSLRELDVLALKAEGLTRNEIAEKLGLSFNTVQNIFGQLSDRNLGVDQERPDFVPMILAAEKSGLLKEKARDILRKIESGEMKLEVAERRLFDD